MARVPLKGVPALGRAALRTLGVAGAAALLVAALVGALGGDPLRALRAILGGAVGTPAGLTESLVKTAPLVFTGLAVAVAFRCGIWNIGAEGQFLAGMLGSSAAALALPPLPPPVAVGLCLLAGTLAGALWAAVPAALRLYRETPEVISTIMLNFLAVYLIEYLVRGALREPGSENDWSPMLPEWTRLARLDSLFGVRRLGGGELRLPDGTPILALGLDLHRLHAGVPWALGAALVVGLWLARSGVGFRMRAVGLNAEAARIAGVSLPRTIATAFLASGGLAGLGGGIEVLGLIQRMYRYEPGAPGYGFTGIAVALLGGLHPAGVVAAAFFFGAFSVGCNQMQREAGISFHVASIIQGSVVLLLVVLPRLRR